MMCVGWKTFRTPRPEYSYVFLLVIYHQVNELRVRQEDKLTYCAKVTLMGIYYLHFVLHC